MKVAVQQLYTLEWSFRLSLWCILFPCKIARVGFAKRANEHIKLYGDFFLTPIFQSQNFTGTQRYPTLHDNNLKSIYIYTKPPGYITRQRHFREWTYFLYSASCFKYMFEGHLCFSTKLRSSTKILRKKCSLNLFNLRSSLGINYWSPS